MTKAPFNIRSNAKIKGLKRKANHVKGGSILRSYI